MLNAADLRYLAAQSVRGPAGQLAGSRVCTTDAQALGTVAGVLIRPSARRLEYLVLEVPGLFTRHQYLLPLDAAPVVQDDGRTLRVPARKDELALEPFQPNAVRPFTDDDLLESMFRQDAA